MIIPVRVIDGRLRIRSQALVERADIRRRGIGLPGPKATPSDDSPARSDTSTPISKLFPTPRSNTITDAENPAAEPARLRRDGRCAAGLYPVESHEHTPLQSARLNDSAFTFEPEFGSRSVSASAAARWGRCIWRLQSGSSAVQYRSHHYRARRAIQDYPDRRRSGRGENPTKFPDPSYIEQIDEPIIDATVITREEYLGGVCLCSKRSAECRRVRIHRLGRVMLVYELPLNEIVLIFTTG